VTTIPDHWHFEDGWLGGVRHVASANCNPRPAGTCPELIVVHGISLPPGQFGSGDIEALFTNRLDPTAHPYFAEVAHLEVSAHFLVRRTGEVVQFVSADERAWHAGVSSWCGREHCNDFSIGIELEGTDHAPYEDPQYEALASLVSVLRNHYPSIRSDAIVGHSDIAPGRKTDPGPAFDWQRVRQAQLS
jgi:AmpD protein